MSRSIFKDKNDEDIFPVKVYRQSSFVKFSINPFMFKVNIINGDYLDTGSNISGVIGSSFHNAMELYYSKMKEDESEAIKSGMEAGMEFLNEYNDGYIEYSTVVTSKQQAQEIFSNAYNWYLRDKVVDEGEEILAVEEKLEEKICLEYKGNIIELPVPLSGTIDKVVMHDGKLKIKDYKTTRAFTNPDKIDGAKIIQSIQYYFLAYAKYGIKPYSMTYEEVKTTKNRDGGPQVKEYEIVYEDNDLFFDFYFRIYEDVTRAINGEAVFVPNINDFFDNEVAIIAYIHRLDVTEERSRLMREMQVDNITDLLKKKIENAGNMRKLLKLTEQKFVSAKNLNYNSMEIEERISTKLMEHGMLLKFDSKIEGSNVNLYRFNPSIGLKMSKIKGYVADIEQVVGASGVRVLAPIPNTTFIGFEIPKKDRVFFNEKPVAEGFNLAIGKDIMGDIYRFDIRKAPHMMVAGATGSGKSVFLNATISQLVDNPNVELHLFDPKMVELGMFAKKAKEYYTETEDIYLALEELVKIMNARYKLLSEAGVRSIDHYDGDMKVKIVVIDEFGDLIISKQILEESVKTGEKYLSGPRKGEEKTESAKINLSAEIEKNILLLAQKARAAGIHMIIATQRPSVDIITGSIKANFPTKVAFRTAKETDSRVLLDEPGAEKLLGKGDMIFSSDEGDIRLQGFNY